MKKLIFLVGAVIGFIAGSAAGRGPYEQLVAKGKEVSENPTVQEKARQAKDRATQVAQDTTASVKDRVSSSASDRPADGTAAGDGEVGDEAPLAP